MQVCFFKNPRHDKYGKYQCQYKPYHRVALPEHLGRGNGIFCKVERTRIDARVVITEITKICPEKKKHDQCSSSKIIRPQAFVSFRKKRRKFWKQGKHCNGQ